MLAHTFAHKSTTEQRSYITQKTSKVLDIFEVKNSKVRHYLRKTNVMFPLGRPNLNDLIN